MKVVDELTEPEHFPGQAGGLVDVLRRPWLAVADELGPVLDRSADLVPRLGLVQVQNQQGEVSSHGVQRSHRYCIIFSVITEPPNPTDDLAAAAVALRATDQSV